MHARLTRRAGNGQADPDGYRDAFERTLCMAISPYKMFSGEQYYQISR